ncbi:DUF1194 domain-containing protein [Phaeobacter porticola]|uniref:von Willebrand factor type A domain protein n=1 Tax=Phaeobacter porticola TaxID=1844006 RepID=A0A1L3I837_9RHOB|nr:DUF1194 domain-containing protein [Phaeobacter porticola]APG48358.1 von Willebrand factor type A domain protein [Phaeobacter porticola]
MQIFRLLVFTLIVQVSTPARACDLALVLAVDVSGSVDVEEYRTQMEGLATALRDGVVAEALVRAQARVALIQWSGSGRQDLTLDWRSTTDFRSIDQLAAEIATAPRPWRNYATGIGEALQLALAQFDQVPSCRRRVIDVSGDGPSNEGIEPIAIRGALSAAGVTVNALAIEESEPDLTAYFFEQVIHGPGAFVQTAARFEDYPQAIRKKLLREVAQQNAGLHSFVPTLQ